AVDKQQGRMIELVENVAHASNIGGDTRRRLVVRDEYGLDLALLICLQMLPVILQRHALTPFDIDGVNIEAKALTEIDPQERELTKYEGQHLVAERQRVGDSRFPGASTRTGKKKDLAALGLEDLLQIAKERQRELRKVRRAIILERNVHGLPNTERHIRRAGDCETLESWHLKLLWLNFVR